MSPEIKVQYLLMQKSIYLLDEIEQLKGFASDYDNEKRRVLQKMYAETMAELAGELIVLGNTKRSLTNHFNY